LKKEFNKKIITVGLIISSVIVQAKDYTDTSIHEGKRYQCVAKEYSTNQSDYIKYGKRESKQNSFFAVINKNFDSIEVIGTRTDSTTVIILYNKAINGVDYYEHNYEKTINGKSEKIKYTIGFTSQKIGLGKQIGFIGLSILQFKKHTYASSYICANVSKKDIK